MNAFKFRAMHDLGRVLGLIASGELWCADWRTLNDPMEGFFYYEPDDAMAETQQLVDSISMGKRGKYVCSLSADFRIATQWAYYADEFRGLALEYDLSELEALEQVSVDRVRYEPLSANFDIYQNKDPMRLAELILLTKIDEWRHEKEIRIISRKEGLLPIPGGVESVTLGSRMARDVKEVISSYCHKRNVKVYELRLDGRGMRRELLLKSSR